jgi:hypothetical protein
MKKSIETTNLRASFDTETGSLIELYSKVSQWDIIKREKLGQSWKMMIPLHEKRNNNALNNAQPVKPECISTDKSIEFKWSSVVSEFGGEHDVTIITKCEAVGQQLVFGMNIANHDYVVIENVYYPYLGDLYRPDHCGKLQFMHGSYSGMKEYEMYPRFPNPVGTHSVDFPTLTVGASAANPPMYPFGLICDDKENGLYIGIAERRIEAVTWHAEALPGWRSSNEFKLFEEDTFEGKDVHTRFSVGHLPYVQPGETFNLLSFGMEAYLGDWTHGVDCYRRVSRNWNKLPLQTMPEWSKNPHSWLQIHINSPEDELRMKFKDLPRIGLECKKFGVAAIQLVGWNDGGQDRGNPSHSPDPRLGTFEELGNAIREIQEMGVKVILFAKFVWADQSREDFESKYLPHAIKNPYGDYEVYKGYQYMTLSQMADVNTRRLIPMCFGSDEYLKICNEEFTKCVDLGADGILFDECLHHSPTLCCFDISHQHRYGESSYQFDEKLIDGFRKIVEGKEFLIAGEAVYDFQHDYYGVSYTRTWGSDHKPTSRYMRPQGKIMTAVVGFHDRNMINQCLLNNYIISFEPYNFKGMLSDYPQTVGYGGKMDALRSDLREYFWDGSFCGMQNGRAALANGENHEHFSVFMTDTGRFGMIICNYDDKNPIRVSPSIGGGYSLTRYRGVDDGTLHDLGEYIEIPPESAVAVI